MYVIGKDRLNDKAARAVEEMTIRQQKQYFYEQKSWIAYYVTCWKLGELTDSEVLRLKKEVLEGKIK